VSKATRHLAVLGGMVWGVLELYALQRSRYLTWRTRL
jgi:hypothetical protein